MTYLQHLTARITVITLCKTDGSSGCAHGTLLVRARYWYVLFDSDSARIGFRYDLKLEEH